MIPTTDSIRELASFWDHHDLTDFEDQLEEVEEPIFDGESMVSTHLPSKIAATIHEVAASRGVADAELIRQWILERVQVL